MLIQAADDAQQLAERLEKSEAGRKKLRQAISILQEKLEGLEKVLKANEKLRQECEQERQRAESEKEKAAEERRLRSQLEKDSSTFKDQMAKVLQRLGAVENKQRSDRKEIERLRTEVKISVEGMHAASQAVNAVQSSIQIVESNLLGKVNAAFEEANNASKAVNVVQSNLQTLQSNLQDKVIEAFEEVRGSSQAVKDVQNSLHSLELRIAKQVAASSEPRFQLAGHVTEKLVDEISHLFNKERQSHCKIKRRLVKLKSAFQETNKSYALSYTDKNAELEGFMSPNRRDEGSQRKRLRAEEDVFERRVRKDRAFDMVIGSNAVDRLGLDQSEMDQSMISPFSMEHQRILDEKPVSFCIPSHNTTSDDNIDTALFDHRSTSKLETRVQMVKAMEDNTEENLTKSMFKVGDRICYNHMVMKNGADSEGQCKDGTGVSQGRKKNLVVDKKDNAEETSPLYRSIAKACGSVTHVDDISHNNGLDHDDNSSDDSEWKWPDDMVLLSPSLPEIPSPSHHIHASSAEPSSKALDPNTDCYLQCNILESNACAVWNAVKSYGDDKTGAGFAKSSDAQFDVNIIRSNDVQCDANYHSKCEVESFAGQKRNQNSDSVVQPGMEMTDNTSNESSDDTAVQNPHTSEGTGFNSRVSVINTDDLISHEIGSAFQEPHAQSDLVSSIEEVSNAIAENHPVVDPFGVSMSGHSVGTGFNNQTERQLETFPLDAVGDVAISEINSFLDVLPPMLGSFQGEIRATDRSVSDPTVPNGGICKFGKASLCDQSMPALEGQLSTSHSSEKIVLELSSPVYGHYNIQETLPLTSEPFNKIKGHEPGDVFLLRCFELQEADAAVNLIATSIIVNDFGRHLADDDIEKGTILLQESMLFRVINDLPLPYVACSIISHAVCLARPEKGITEANSTVHIVDSLLQAYVAFISSMYKEKANVLLDTIFDQLRRFLINGDAIRVTLRGSVSACDNALSIARVLDEKKQCNFQYARATLEDIYAGGKVLAALCQVLACVTHLQNIVYEVLGWCDKDIEWLLTIFSSFSSICGHSAFIIEADDLLGHAICAIILEIMANFEPEIEKTSESATSQSIESPICKGFMDHRGWVSLKEALLAHGKLTMKEVIHEVMVMLRHFMTSKATALFSYPRTDISTAKGCDYLHETKICCETLYKGITKNLCKEKENASRSTLTGPHEGCMASSANNSCEKAWQRKYAQVAGALELVSQFMGWEWTYNNLIIRFLWKMVPARLDQFHAAGLSHIFSLLFRIAEKGSKTDLPGLADLKRHIVDLLQSTPILIGKAESLSLH